MIISNKIDNRNKTKPELTVLFSYYNNQKTIRKSLNSILNQSIKNYEIIIYSDGSNDNSDTIVKKIIKNKSLNILFLKSNINKGLTKALNYILKYARGKYLARHDADDISLRKRFEYQLNFLKKNKNIQVLGTNVIHVKDKKRKKILMPESNYLIKKKLPSSNSIIHSTVVMLKKVLVKNKYNEKFIRCQDYELWLRNKNNINYHNLQKILVIRNLNKNQFNLIDLYFSCLARFKNINFLLFCLYNVKDLFYYLLKKIL
tara:strand:- start:6153 stop:6929 length:777 start_codon:yes stop_codon:yes gene_type:complete